MTEHYVTLFDSSFLPQGLALHHSLRQHDENCLLWVLCLDEVCLKNLERFSLPQIRPLALADFETPELLEVKPSRSRAEYCWTLTPWAIQWIFETEPKAQRVTYLDADVFFLKSPAPILAEFENSGKAVLITDHNYSPEYDMTTLSGRYCVQFLTVTRILGEPILHWWRDRCLEWCYARFENNLFGDQKYIEQFPVKFPDLVFCCVKDPRFQAPWNCSILPYSDAILYHFHGLRLVSSSMISLAHSKYYIPKPTRDNIYYVYCSLLVDLIARFGFSVKAQISRPSLKERWLLSLRKWIFRKATPLSQPPYWFEQKPDKSTSFIW